MNKSLKHYFILAIMTMACGDRESDTNSVFVLVAPEESGITFRNEIENTSDLNILNYMYFNNGGGVAVEDFNNDGLVDVYFTSNQESNKLYINQGSFVFKDFTTEAKVAGPTESWTTGVTTVDINNDGWIDIYVSLLGKHLGIFGSNQLYINQGLNENGVPTFTEESAKYGLDLVGFSTQAAFFDYDLDGDLDMYQLNHSLHSNGTFVKRTAADSVVHKYAGDKLMENQSGKFVDVSVASGIRSNQLGYGLGIAIFDSNLDGYPDIYIGNDFHEDDYLYLNNGDGTFKESLHESIRLTSRYSMGNDVADLNQDGWPDIVSVDMLPYDYQILKASQTEDNYEIFEMKKGLGYGSQYSRNSLQLNNGDGSYSEIGLFAGIEASDWSWSPLIADFDLDGDQEILVTNGIVKRPNDMDYLNYTIAEKEKIGRAQIGSTRLEDLEIIDLMPELKLGNRIYSQTKPLNYEEVSSRWGLGSPSYSSGSAYVDFDNDGDLDLVVNNTGDAAFLYRNTSVKESSGKAFINFRLQYKDKNRDAIGSKVTIRLRSGKILSKEVYRTRGFQSSVTAQLYFGLPVGDPVESIEVLWPDRTMQIVGDGKINALNIINYEETTPLKVANNTQHFSTASIEGIDFTHAENTYFHEFTREPLIVHSLATEGPAMAVGDYNNDGVDDVYLGGGKNQTSSLFASTSNGFKKMEFEAFAADKLQEEVEAQWVDIDADSDLDLIVLTGGNEYSKGEEAMGHSIYLNEGGNLVKKRNAFNGLKFNGGAISFHDYTGDGFVDAFLGARSVAWKYGVFPDSYLLVNDGKGNFMVDIERSKLTKELGMVRDAEWGDVNGDGSDDLVIVGDWFPITILLSKNGSLEKADPADLGLEKTNGYWSALEVADVNADGRKDLIVGNLGTNTKLKAFQERPMHMYVNDFNQNGAIDPLIYTHREGEDKLFATKDELTGRIIEIKKKFNTHQEFSRASQEEIIPEKWKKASLHRQIFELESCVFLNTGNKFSKVSLPREAQFSPIYSWSLQDINADGALDLIAGGNLYAVSTQIGKYDASYGNVFLNNGKGTFENMNKVASGLKVTGEIRQIEELILNKKKYLLFARNNDSLAILELKTLNP